MILISSFFSLGVKADLVPNLKKVNQTFNYIDDMNFEHMLKAIVRQEKYFQSRSLSQKIKFGSRMITRNHLKKSILTFKKYVTQALNCFQLYPEKICYTEFSNKMNKNFEVYKPMPLTWEKGYKEKKTFFTAYYSPDFEASFTKTKEFKNPIYMKPTSVKLQKVSSDEVNFQNKLKGYELIYVKKSLYDIWLLHVEGGGRARVKQADGTFKYHYLSYDGANGQSFKMLYKYMIAQSMLKKGEATIAKQREYFVNNPKDQRAILKTCPSFIFFKITKDEPLGVHNMSLTENRSLATDYRRLKEYGIINFVRATKPVIVNDQVNQTPYSRFFLNQDTGGAIKGNARSDLYFGYGDKAELAANYVYGLGEQYFLILK
jgi:membrane-bound lytic murein transglycosylase A